MPQYYVEHSHPAIIDRAMFDAVQTEIKKRAEPGQRTYTPYTLSGKIYCAECGARYGSKCAGASNLGAATTGTSAGRIVPRRFSIRKPLRTLS